MRHHEHGNLIGQGRDDVGHRLEPTLVKKKRDRLDAVRKGHANGNLGLSHQDTTFGVDFVSQLM